MAEEAFTDAFLVDLSDGSIVDISSLTDTEKKKLDLVNFTDVTPCIHGLNLVSNYTICGSAFGAAMHALIANQLGLRIPDASIRFCKTVLGQEFMTGQLLSSIDAIVSHVKSLLGIPLDAKTYPEAGVIDNKVHTTVDAYITSSTPVSKYFNEWATTQYNNQYNSDPNAPQVFLLRNNIGFYNGAWWKLKSSDVGPSPVMNLTPFLKTGGLTEDELKSLRETVPESILKTYKPLSWGSLSQKRNTNVPKRPIQLQSKSSPPLTLSNNEAFILDSKGIILEWTLTTGDINNSKMKDFTHIENRMRSKAQEKLKRSLDQGFKDNSIAVLTVMHPGKYAFLYIRPRPHTEADQVDNAPISDTDLIVDFIDSPTSDATRIVSGISDPLETGTVGQDSESDMLLRDSNSSDTDSPDATRIVSGYSENTQKRRMEQDSEVDVLVRNSDFTNPQRSKVVRIVSGYSNSPKKRRTKDIRDRTEASSQRGSGLGSETNATFAVDRTVP